MFISILAAIYLKVSNKSHYCVFYYVLCAILIFQIQLNPFLCTFVRVLQLKLVYTMCYMLTACHPCSKAAKISIHVAEYLL